MKISDVLNITGGELVTEPSIQAVEGATVYPSKVENGDLFFAGRREDIPKAVENGAYAVIFEGDTPTGMDDEIAWIEVPSVREAAFRLLRYVQLRKESEIYLLENHEYTFLKMIVSGRSPLVFLPDEWMKAFEALLNGEGSIFVTTDEVLARSVSANPERIEEPADGYMVSDTLFRSTFRIGSYIYQNREMAPFHLGYLLKAVGFCDRREIPYSIERLRYTRHFMPVFVDAKLSRVSGSESDRVVIFCDNREDIVAAREYVRYQSSWARSIVLTPPSTKVDGVERPIWFEGAQEAREILKKSHFNYAFIYSTDSTGREILEEIDRQEASLFG